MFSARKSASRAELASPTAAAADLSALIRPIYIPSLVYASGASILVPAQILLALQLGFGTAGVVAMMTWIGAFGVFASFSAGYLVAWFGERRAVLATSALGVSGLILAAFSALGGAPLAPWALIIALTIFDLVDAVWSIARQSLVAELAPEQIRGRAMNLYGACQRIGRIFGPLICAAILVFAPVSIALLAAGLLVLVATWLLGISSSVRARGADIAVGKSPTSEVSSGAKLAVGAKKQSMRALAILGLGVLILSCLRTAKESLIPLWGAQELGLAAEYVALTAGIASAMELLLFWPAGWALDKLGRAPVVVTALTLMALGFLLMPANTHVAWFVGSAMLVGLGDGAGAGIIKVLGVDVAPNTRRAQFLGQWQSVASVGALAAPAAITVCMTVGTLSLAVASMGVLGIVGAVWMAWWTPRFIPRKR